MCTVARAMTTRLRELVGGRAALPAWLLAALLVISLLARVAWLGEPCRSPCRAPSDHLLVFDETYYVNAARVIAGIHPPAGVPYADAPLWTDPNSEHPQLVKLLIAGGIELFGDGPVAWRLPSIVLGLVAILGMFALALAAGGGRWVALGAAALMAADNLLLVHGRIGTLDIPGLAFMVWAAALYLRGRPVLAGVLIGIGAGAKEVAPYVLFGLAVLELLRWARARTEVVGRLVRLALCSGASAVSFLILLAVMDRIAPPYSPQTGKLVPNGVFGHISRIVSYAAHQTSPHGPTGIASYPWAWLLDLKPITYLEINPGHPTAALHQIEPAVHFWGMINPAILLLGLPALVWVAVGVARHRPPREPGPSVSEVGVVGLAWFLGTYLPFVLASLIASRTSYLYYMVIVMPGIYLAAADFVRRIGPERKLVLAWMGCVVAAAVVMFPFTPLP
jgi:predicted membrane-bound dolichyl-phosphate-mannose-protein mannosyltransferase